MGAAAKKAAAAAAVGGSASQTIGENCPPWGGGWLRGPWVPFPEVTVLAKAVVFVTLQPCDRWGAALGAQPLLPSLRPARTTLRGRGRPYLGSWGRWEAGGPENASDAAPALPTVSGRLPRGKGACPGGLGDFYLQPPWKPGPLPKPSPSPPRIGLVLEIIFLDE